MEGHCSTSQSPQWAVVPMEEEEEDTYFMDWTVAYSRLVSDYYD